eukprot:gene4775-1563_t
MHHEQPRRRNGTSGAVISKVAAAGCRTADFIRGCARKVWKFDQESGLSLSGQLVLAAALARDIREAVAETSALAEHDKVAHTLALIPGKKKSASGSQQQQPPLPPNEKFKDGQALEELVQAGQRSLKRLQHLCKPEFWRKLSGFTLAKARVLSSSERHLVENAIALLAGEIEKSEETTSRIRREDIPKIANLLLAGKQHFPWMVVHSSVGVVSGYLLMTVMGQTKGTTRFASGLVSLMLTRLIQIGVRRLQGIIYNKGFGQYRKTISGAVLKK